MAAVSSKLPPRSVRSFPSSLEKDTKSVHFSTTLTRRLLFPQLPPGAELPPLLSSDSLPPELDAEIYDFFALALRAFINPWWTKITRYDKEFLIQVNSLLTQIVRSLETRLSSTDICPLLFRDIPSLISQHYDDYRTAVLKLNTSYSLAGAASRSQLFHQFQPHMAITAYGQVDEDYIRQYVDFILKACLPLQDYNPDTERYIIREVVVKIILDVMPRLSQPWFIHKLALDILDSFESKSAGTNPSEPAVKAQPLSFHVVVIFILSTIQSLSGFCLTLIHGYKQVLQTIKQVNSAPRIDRSRNATPPSLSFDPSSVHLHASPVSTSSFMSSGAGSTRSPSAPPSPHVLAQPASSFVNYDSQYAQPVLKLISTVFCLHTRFASAALFNTIEMLAAASASFLDRLLPHILYKQILSPPRLIEMIKNVKKAFFPNGYLAPPPVDPTPEEQVELRQRLAHKIGEIVPWWLSPILLGPKTKHETINGMLDPLSSPECNAHLLLFLLDAVLLTGFPELGQLTDVNLVERCSTSPSSGSEKQESDESILASAGIGAGVKVPHATSPAAVQRSMSTGSVFAFG